ncbi:MAG: ABC transporter permease [Candidatus Marinimicrobia bacterium]|nr:ABC transporter permease [Candidatus Neomarinimicrobiota bacterium]
MICHLFKLMWNRKRKNFLMTVEIFISFLVLFFALTLLIFNLNNYLRPLGFSYDHIWFVTFDWKDTPKEEVRESLQQVKGILNSYTEVENHAFSKSFIFMSFTSNNGTFNYKNNEINIELLNGEDTFDDVLGIRIVEGRWFDESDNVYNQVPVVINRNTEKNLFLGESGLGKVFADNYDNSKKEFKVIGIIDDFRNTGQYSQSKNVMFRRINLHEDIEINEFLQSSMLNRLLIKVRPGTDAVFEQKMMQQLSAVAKGFNFKIKTAEAAKKNADRSMLVLPVLMIIIGGFLVINVALGLFGIIWYNINNRRSEIGLRRALGSSVNRIYGQIIGESLVLSTFSIILGCIIAIQFPLLNFIGFIDVEIYYVALIATIVLIYLVALFCALYPGKIAAQIEPATALHYE